LFWQHFQLHADVVVAGSGRSVGLMRCSGELFTPPIGGALAPGACGKGAGHRQRRRSAQTRASPGAAGRQAVAVADDARTIT